MFIEKDEQICYECNKNSKKVICIGYEAEMPLYFCKICIGKAFHELTTTGNSVQDNFMNVSIAVSYAYGFAEGSHLQKEISDEEMEAYKNFYMQFNEIKFPIVSRGD